MATHSSVLAWRIPGTGKPGGLPFMGLHRVGHDWSDLAAAYCIPVTYNIIYQLYFYLMLSKVYLYHPSLRISHRVTTSQTLGPSPVSNLPAAEHREPNNALLIPAQENLKELFKLKDGGPGVSFCKHEDTWANKLKRDKFKEIQDTQRRWNVRKEWNGGENKQGCHSSQVPGIGICYSVISGW